MSDQVSTTATPPIVTNLVADIVSAFVSHNSVPASEIPALIASVHGALQNVANPAPAQATEKPTPAVPVKKSVTPDAIISLIDGKPYKSLKRHITKQGLTPAEYRERYGLPRDYPMVAPNYAAKRSELARTMGLGQSRRKEAPKSAETSEKVASKAPKKGRSKKAV